MKKLIIAAALTITLASTSVQAGGSKKPPLDPPSKVTILESIYNLFF